MCYILVSFPVLLQFQFDLLNKISVTAFFDKSKKIFMYMLISILNRIFCPFFLPQAAKRLPCKKLLTLLFTVLINRWLCVQNKNHSRISQLKISQIIFSDLNHILVIFSFFILSHLFIVIEIVDTASFQFSVSSSHEIDATCLALMLDS